MYTLATIDSTTLIGQRDYALLLVPLETGRGAAELSGLTFADLAWTDDQERAVISWRVHGRKQLKKVRQEIGPAVALPLRKWIQARMAAGYSGHEYVFLTLSNNATAGAPMSVQSIKAMCTKRLRLGTARAPRASARAGPASPGALRALSRAQALAVFGLLLRRRAVYRWRVYLRQASPVQLQVPQQWPGTQGARWVTWG